jgi:hypothetical protein
MITADILSAIWSAWPIFLGAFVLFIWAQHRWATRFERGNGRPAVACAICGRKYQRGLPLEWHMNQHRFKRDKR